MPLSKSLIRPAPPATFSRKRENVCARDFDEPAKRLEGTKRIMQTLASLAMKKAA